MQIVNANISHLKCCLGALDALLMKAISLSPTDTSSGQLCTCSKLQGNKCCIIICIRIYMANFTKRSQF